MKLEVEHKSVAVAQDLSHDLLSIISESSDKMTPFIKLFWEQQKKSATFSPEQKVSPYYYSLVYFHSGKISIGI